MTNSDGSHCYCFECGGYWYGALDDHECIQQHVCDDACFSEETLEEGIKDE